MKGTLALARSLYQKQKRLFLACSHSIQLFSYGLSYDFPTGRLRPFFRNNFETTKKNRHPNKPPNVFSIKSSMSADLPVKYCVNSIANESNAKVSVTFQRFRILGKATGSKNPSGTNITTLAAVWAIFFGFGIPQVS